MAFQPSDNEIIIGTNEEYVMGYNVIEKEDGDVHLELSFANHAHTGRVKQVAISNNFLVSGGTDEFIRIFNLRSRKEVGYFLPHEGTVTCLHFHHSGFLFSGSEDGKINIFKKGKWELEKEMSVGTSGVNGIAVHPSGKLALSISKDRKLITWDLMKGKRVFTSALKKAGELISWSLAGTHYLIASANILDIYDVETANVVHSIDFGENIYCFCFVTDDLLLIGGEKQLLSLFNLPLQKEVFSWEAHENRTKSLVKLWSKSKDEVQIASGSSDGYIKIWSLNIQNPSSAKLIGKVETKCRIICMAVYSSTKETQDIQNKKEDESIIAKNTKRTKIKKSIGGKKQKLMEVDSSLASVQKKDKFMGKKLKAKKTNLIPQTEQVNSLKKKSVRLTSHSPSNAVLKKNLPNQKNTSRTVKAKSKKTINSKSKRDARLNAKKTIGANKKLAKKKNKKSEKT